MQRYLFLVFILFQKTQTKLNVRFIANARTPGAIVIYSLAPFGLDYNYFRVDAATGDVNVTSDLDFEEQRTYEARLRLSAADCLWEGMAFFVFVFLHFIILFGHLIWVRLQQSHEQCYLVLQVHVGSFRVSVIHRTWTTGS